MKLTKSKLRQLIKEELKNVLEQDEYETPETPYGIGDERDRNVEKELGDLNERINSMGGKLFKLEKAVQNALKQIARVEGAIKPGAWQGGI